MAVGPINIYEYEPLAKERLSKSKYDFIAGGATDEITLQRTRRILDAIVLRPKVMEDVSAIDTENDGVGAQHQLSRDARSLRRPRTGAPRRRIGDG